VRDEKKTKAELIAEISELRRHLGLFKSMVEDSQDGIVVSDAGGRVTYFSPGAESLTGYKAEEALQMRAADFYPGGGEAARRIMQRLRQEGRTWDHRQEFIAKDGSVIEAFTSTSLLHDENGEETGVLVIYKNANEQNGTELDQGESTKPPGKLSEKAPLEVGQEDETPGRAPETSESDGTLNLTANENAGSPDEAAGVQRAVEKKQNRRVKGEVGTAGRPTTTTPLKPERAEFYYNLAVAYYALGERERAIDDYNEAVRLNPEYAAAFNSRGKAYHDLGQHARAIEDYGEAVRLNPEYSTAYNNRGIAYYDQGRHEHAIEDYGAAVRVDSEYAAAYNNRGNAYRALGQQERAIEDYDAAIGLDAENAAAYNNRGTAYHALGLHARAIEDYDAAVRLNPEYAAAYNNRGTAYVDLGKHERAMEDYDAAIGLNPEDREVYINRGNVLSRLCQYERSVEDYDAAIRLNPNYPEAYIGRGVAFIRLGRYAESEKDFARAEELKAVAGGSPSDQG